MKLINISVGSMSCMALVALAAPTARSNLYAQLAKLFISEDPVDPQCVENVCCRDVTELTEDGSGLGLHCYRYPNPKSLPPFLGLGDHPKCGRIFTGAQANKAGCCYHCDVPKEYFNTPATCYGCKQRKEDDRDNGTKPSGLWSKYL